MLSSWHTSEMINKRWGCRKWLQTSSEATSSREIQPVPRGWGGGGGGVDALISVTS